MGLQIRDGRQMKALTGLSQAQFDSLRAKSCPYRLESRSYLYRACHWWHEALHYFGTYLSD